MVKFPPSDVDNSDRSENCSECSVRCVGCSGNCRDSVECPRGDCCPCIDLVLLQQLLPKHSPLPEMVNPNSFTMVWGNKLLSIIAKSNLWWEYGKRAVD